MPPGGFHWIEKFNGADIKLTGDSVPNLAANLEKYRLTNGIPLGNPVQEIVDYICGNWPHFCNETNSPYLEGNVPGPTAQLATRVASWMTRLWNFGAGNFVPDAEARRRASTCETCDLNKDFRAGGCGSCVQGTDRLAFLWLGSTRKALDGQPVWDKLKACRATGAHLQAGVFASKQPDMSAEEQLQLSPKCWRRT